MFRVLPCLRLWLFLTLPLWPAAAQPPAAEAPVPAPAPSLPTKANPDIPVGSPDPFVNAVTAYKAGSYEAARKDFLAIVDSGKISAAVAHNLGNVEFRMGNPGQAALWYRRALAIQPFSPETLQNLRTIRRQTAFLSFDPWLLSRSYLKRDWVINGTILAAWASGMMIVWLAWLTPAPGRRWPLITALALLLPGLAAGATLTWRIKTDPAPLVSRQVISGDETMAYTAPAEASSSVIALPAGSEVVPLETRGNWIYCMIPGDEAVPLRGWVRQSELEPLWPWPGGYPKGGSL